MIPPFDDAGYLPPGVHLATLDEVEARFGRASQIRQDQMQSLHWMVDLAVRARAQRIVLNGSFVTAIIEPNDVDCVLLFSPGAPRDSAAFKELEAGLPFLDIALADPDEFEECGIL